MFHQSFITLTPDSLQGCREGIIKRDLIKTKQAPGKLALPQLYVSIAWAAAIVALNLIKVFHLGDGGHRR